MVNENTRKKIEEIVDLFKKQGWKPKTKYQPANGACLIRDDLYKEFYLGTFLNSFSAMHWKEGDLLLWSDQKAYEYAAIEVKPVYRHNGTSEDVSIEISVHFCHDNVKVWPKKFDFDSTKSQEYVDLVKRLAPMNYLEKPETWTFNVGYSKPERVAKLRNTAKDRAINNAIKKAIDMASTFQPNDWSSFVKDRKDYHVDNTEEYNAWLAKQKQENAL